MIADRIGGFLGPLAGILSGFEWMRANRSEARWLASFACDCPFFPADMVKRLIAEAQSRDVKIALAFPDDHQIIRDGRQRQDCHQEAEQA